MTNLYRYFIAPLCFIPWVCLACEPTYAEMVDIAKRDRAIEERYVSKLFAESDFVVVGVVSDVRDSDDPGYAQIATVSVEKTLRGAWDRSISFLMYKFKEVLPPSSDDNIPPLESIPACGEPLNPEQEHPYLQDGFRVLVYVKDGLLKRAVSFPIEPEPLFLDARSEIEFLQAVQAVGGGGDG